MKNIYVIALAAILFQGCGQKKEMTAPDLLRQLLSNQGQ
jgi:hypothetical protein